MRGSLRFVSSLKLNISLGNKLLTQALKVIFVGENNFAAAFTVT